MLKLSTQLKDRELRFDGVNIVHPDNVAYFICQGVPPGDLLVSQMNTEIEQFNEQVSDEESIKLAGSTSVSIDLSWNIPKKYLELNLQSHIIEVFESLSEKLNYSPEEFQIACDRINLELNEIEERGMEEFIRTVIYIIDTFRKTDQVWGVGRGSSCASYILFLVGLHVVDCVRMDVPAEEFFHD